MFRQLMFGKNQVLCHRRRLHGVLGGSVSGTPADDFLDVFGVQVHGQGTDDRTRRRLLCRAEQEWTRFVDLYEQFVEPVEELTKRESSPLLLLLLYNYAIIMLLYLMAKHKARMLSNCE